MKRNHKILIILGVLAVVGFIYAFRVQTFAKGYTIPTTANEPGLVLGGWYFGSSLFKLEKLDFVVFDHTHEYFGEGKWVFRLIAEAGDTLQIVKGITTVNGEIIDRNLDLKHEYQVNEESFNSLKNSMDVSDARQIEKDVYIMNLSDSFALDHHFEGAYKEMDYEDAAIKETYGHPWNADEFGPFIIPAETIFVMGDNRHNALDSRFIGVIDLSKIVAVIKNK